MGAKRRSVAEVFLAFLRLGCTSFGGPVAHLGYFRTEFVERRRWLDEAAYADIVALCQFLPGPGSTQAGMALGILRAGIPGGVAAWAGFSLPSAVLMMLFAYFTSGWTTLNSPAWLHGLKLVAVAIVAQAVWGMAKTLSVGRERASITVAAAVIALAFPSVWGQVGAIVLGAIAGWMVLPATAATETSSLPLGVNRITSTVSLVLFVVLLVGLPIIAATTTSRAIEVFDAFYRSGALVFGGGHVVLPLLQAEVVPNGWLRNDAFLAGYGAAQAIPGPLFTFAAYLGWAMAEPPNRLAGGLLCLVALFLPSFLLIVGLLPHWDRLRRTVKIRTALAGVNAAVVGLLLAALYTPVWISAVYSPIDFALTVVAFLLLAVWRTPPWAVVVLGAAAAWALAAVGAPM